MHPFRPASCFQFVIQHSAARFSFGEAQTIRAMATQRTPVTPQRLCNRKKTNALRVRASLGVREGKVAGIKAKRDQRQDHKRR